MIDKLSSAAHSGLPTVLDDVGFGDPGGEAPFVPTNLARDMMTLITITHSRQRMSAFAGPVGIGKTRAILALAEGNETELAVIKVAGDKSISEIQFLLAVTNQLRRKLGADEIESKALGRSTIHRAFRSTLAHWGKAGPHMDKTKRTIIVDEAQSLAPAAISAIRFWNDPDGCLGPYPVGFAFVGNQEFSLQPSKTGQSALSYAVADRLLYSENYSYCDVTDDDIRAYVQSFEIVAEPAIELVIKNLARLSPTRSLRAVNRLLDELKAHARGGALDTSAFHSAFDGKLSARMQRAAA